MGSRPGLAESLCQVIAAYALRLNFRAGTEGSTVSSLICDRWLILGLETLLEPLITDGLLLYALAGHQWLCSHAPLSWTLWPTVQGAHELRPSIMQYVLAAREIVARPSRVNITAQGLSTPDPSLSHTHLSRVYKDRSCNKYTLHTPSG